MSPGITFVLVGAVFVVVGGWFAIGGVRTARTLRAFSARAVRTTGRVTELRVTWMRRDDRPDVRLFRPVVRFALPDGRQVETATISARAPAPAQVGEVIEIRFDPEDPTRADLVVGAAGGGVSCLHIGLGIAFVVLGLAALGVGYVVTQVLP